MPKKKVVPTGTSAKSITTEDTQRLVEVSKELEPQAEAPEVEVEAPREEEVNKTYSVYNSDGGFVRAFTLEVHGENAGELAQEFAATNGYSVRS
jgi:hypothetical protein